MERKFNARVQNPELLFGFQTLFSVQNPIHLSIQNPDTKSNASLGQFMSKKIILYVKQSRLASSDFDHLVS